MKRSAVFLITTFTLLLSISSCVSKKKFEDLARAKRGVDRELYTMQNENKRLEEQILSMEDDFNLTIYKLSANNAAKDTHIDELVGTLRQLESKESALKSELKDATEQAKYTEAHSSQQVSQLQSQIKTISTERDGLRKKLNELQTNLEWDNRKLQSEIETINKNIKIKDDLITKLEKDIDAVNNQLSNSRKNLKEKEAEVEKLTNQVNLLKKELIR